MPIECERVYFQSWIKLQQVNQQTYPSIQRLKRSLDQSQEDEQKKQFLQQTSQVSSYISPILSLQKKPKRIQKGQIKLKKRLLFHNYTKFKTIPFSYKNIYMPKQYSANLSKDLSDKVTQTVLQDQLNFCFIGFGSKQSQIQSLLQGNTNSSQGIFYQTLIKINQQINHINQKSIQFSTQSKIEFTINFIAVTENKLIDLMDVNNQIYVKQKQGQNKKSIDFITPLQFEGATQYNFYSNYQLYTTMKKIFFRRKQLSSWNVLIIKINFEINNQNNQSYNKSALLIEWTKQSYNVYDEAKFNRIKKVADTPLLTLNQCILQIFKIIQLRIHKLNRSNQENRQKLLNQFSQEQINKLSNLQCFRNSLITRILKPYLLFQCQFVFMSCCSISQEHQNDSYQSLMLGKHISKLYTLKKNKCIQIASNRSIKRKENQTQISSDQINQQRQSNKQRIYQSKGQTNKNRRNFQKQDQEMKNFNKIKEAKKQLIQINKPGVKQLKVRQKLINLLQQAKQRQNYRNKDVNEFKSINVKIFEQKRKSLKVKKQLNMLKVKSHTKHLRSQILQKNDSDKEQINQQIKRLDFDEKKIYKQLQNLNNEIKQKLLSLNQIKPQAQGQSPVQKQKKKVQKLQILKNHLKNQLEMTEIEINEFLQQKQSIKSVYHNEINSINRQQKQLIKKISFLNNRNSITLDSRVNQKQLPKMRLVKQMSSVDRNNPEKLIQGNISSRINSLNKVNRSLDNNNYGRKLTLSSKNERYQQIFKSSGRQKVQKKSSMKLHTQSFDSMDIQSLKKSKELIRKNKHLKQKIGKGRIEYARFLQDTVQKYIDYAPKKGLSTK